MALGCEVEPSLNGSLDQIVLDFVRVVVKVFDVELDFRLILFD